MYATSFVFLVVAVVALGIGFIQGGLTFVFVSIGAAIASLLFLIASLLRKRPIEPATAGAPFGGPAAGEPWPAAAGGAGRPAVGPRTLPRRPGLQPRRAADETVELEAGVTQGRMPRGPAEPRGMPARPPVRRPAGARPATARAEQRLMEDEMEEAAPARRPPVRGRPTRKPAARKPATKAPTRKAPAKARKPAAKAPARKTTAKAPSRKPAKAPSRKPAAKPAARAPAKKAAAARKSSTGATVIALPERGTYHISGCRFVKGRRDTEKVTKATAHRRGYSACGVCKPG